MNIKFYSSLFVVLFCLILEPLSAQTGGVTIGEDRSPHHSAILDLQSKNKGFLPPRLSTAQRNRIPSPASGLVVFDTDAKLLFLFDGQEWKPLTTGSGFRTSSVATNSLDSTAPDAFPAANVTAFDKDLGKLLVSDGNVWRDGNTGCLPSFYKKITCSRPTPNAAAFDQSGNLLVFPANTARTHFDLVSGKEIGLLVEANDSNMLYQSESLIDQFNYNGTTWNANNVKAALSGTLAGRPRFLLTKLDALNYSSYRKLGLKLALNTTYLCQLMVQRKSCTTFTVGIHSDGPNTDGLITLDLLTGDITGGGSTTVGTFFNARAIPIKSTAGAWLLSFNFIPAAAANNTTHQLRMIPASTVSGDALYVSSPSFIATTNGWGTYVVGNKTPTARGLETLKVDLGLQSSGSILVKGLMNDRITSVSRAISWKASTGSALSMAGDGFTGGYAIADNGTLLESSGQFIPYTTPTGTAYYIDPTADSNGTGSISSPFRSTTQIPALSGNLNGTQILIKRGTTLKEEFDLNNCSNFVIDAYGTGPLPIIDAADTVKLVWEQEGDVWFIAGQALGQTLFVNGIRYISVYQKAQMSTTAATSWFEPATQRIYINPGAGVNPNTQLVEVTSKPFATKITGSSNFTVRNIQFQRARNSGLSIIGGNKGLVEKCIAVYNGAFDGASNLAGDGFVWYGNGSSAKTTGNILRHCVSNYNLNCCYEFGFHDSLLLEDNYAIRNGQGIELWGYVTNSTLRRNRILNTIPVGTSWGHGNGVWMPNSSTQAGITGGQNNNKIIANVFATSWNESIDIAAGKHEITGNLFFDPTRRREDNFGTFLYIGRKTVDTINVTLKNNIFYQPTFQGYPVAAFIIDNTVSTAVLNNNFYYADPAIGGYTSFTYMGTGYGGNFAAYKTATNQDLNSVARVDPKFVKIASKTVTDVYQTFVNGSSRNSLLIMDEDQTDFHLAEGSPCIAAGDPTIGGTVGVDFVPYGTSKAVGPYSSLAGTAVSLGDYWLGGCNFRGGTLVDIQASKGTLRSNAEVIQLSMCK